MRWYPWLRPHFEKLITSYQDGYGHHSLLVQTLPGMGGDSLIYAIIRFLMCKRPEQYKSCRKCRNCQLMQSETHPDYHVLNLEKSNGMSEIGINFICNMKEKLYEHASISNIKVVWLLNDAALLTETASNALLKIVEEPPEKTWFFFSCFEPWRLLATFRSRCCLYNLTVPQEAWSVSWLQQKVAAPQNVVLTALRLCDGAPAAALELLQKDHYWTQRVQICSVLENALEDRNWLNFLTVLNHKQSSLRLKWLITLLLDALIFQQGVTTITNVDVCSLISKLARILTSTVLHVIVRDLCKCRKKLLKLSGLDRELVLTDQLLTIEYYLQDSTILPVFYP